MGCDIHFYVEKKDENGNWISADKWKQDKDDDHPHVPYRSSYYSGRNYGLFSILADVRNGFGFAGVDTGEGYIPICKPRGLPDDCSENVRKASDDYGIDGHSQSFLHLKELLDYDWTQVTTKRAVCALDEFIDWDWRKQIGETGGPQSYCGGVMGKDIVTLTPADAALLLAKGKAKADGLQFDQRAAEIREAFSTAYPDKEIYIHVQWTEPYYDTGREFLAATMPRLLKLANGDFDSVRCVFWFDN